MSMAHKAFQIGLGIADKGASVARKGIEELRKAGEISEKEAKAMLRQAASEAKKEQDTAVRLIRQETKKALAAAGLATKAEVRKLQQRIAKLEKAKKR